MSGKFKVYIPLFLEFPCPLIWFDAIYVILFKYVILDLIIYIFYIWNECDKTKNSFSLCELINILNLKNFFDYTLCENYVKSFLLYWSILLAYSWGNFMTKTDILGVTSITRVGWLNCVQFKNIMKFIDINLINLFLCVS